MMKGKFGQALVNHGYDLRERMNIYGGMLAGALAPIVAGRYILAPTANLDLKHELIAWAGSLAMNLVTTIPSPHLPVPFYTAMFGEAMGCMSAIDLRRQRMDNATKNLETTVTQQTPVSPVPAN
ncbi:MAG: hypothetical protein WCK90_05465 [archaeon]